MPLFMQCSKEEFEAGIVTNPADYYTRECDGMTIYMHTSHRGIVLKEGEHNWHDDSDFYALVWDAAQQKVVEITWGTTRCWSYCNGCTVDATPEVRALADAYWDGLRKLAAERRALAEAAEAEVRAARKNEAARMEALKGKTVTLGKTKPITGELFWVRCSISGKSVRVGVRDASGQAHFGSSSSVKAA